MYTFNKKIVSVEFSGIASIVNQKIPIFLKVPGFASLPACSQA